MTIQIGDIVRVVISYSNPASSVAQNVFYYECQDSTADDDQALDDLQTWFTANWLDNWAALADETNSAFLLEADILNLDGTVDRNLGERGLSVDGDGIGEAAPSAVSGYMQASSERTGSVGRKYVPFVSEATILDGYFTSSALSVLADLLTDYLTALTIDTLATFVPGIISRAVTGFFEFAVSGYTTNIPAYQRRRKPGVGS